MDKLVVSVHYKGIDFSIYQAELVNFEFKYDNWFYVTLKDPDWFGPYLSNNSKFQNFCENGWTETIQEAFLKIANYI
jgi:hypothetical protein